MSMITMDRMAAAEDVLQSLPLDTSISFKKNRYMAGCYWPNADVLRDIGCYGYGPTLEAAIAEMLAEIEKARTAQRPLRTAAECKTAVLQLIREHEAAPASFRDAVDALPVKS